MILHSDCRAQDEAVLAVEVFMVAKSVLSLQLYSPVCRAVHAGVGKAGRIGKEFTVPLY